MKKKLLVVPALLTMLTMASCAFIDSIKSSNPTAIKTSDVSPTTEPCGSTASNTSDTSQNSTNSTIPSTSKTTNTSTSTGTPSIPTSTSTSKASSSSTNSQASADPITNTINITESKGYGEGAYVNFEAISGHTYSAYYKKGTSNTLYNVDSELVRVNGDSGRIDVLGLSPDDYYIKIVDNNDSSKVALTNKLTVSEQDRSGYAHFGSTNGVGAYKNDGTLKNNAVVVYVNESNKNTVTAKINNTTYTGLSNILQHATNENYPVNVRILGTIGAATWKSVSNSKYKDQADSEIEPTNTVKGLNNQYLQLQNYDESAIISGGFNELDTSVYSKLNGLTNKIKYDSSKYEFDSYYNMLDISGAKNVTVEGVGDDAIIFQWGFTWKSNCQSIEVKNITFDDYTEDACSFEGPSDYTSVSSSQAKRYWIHNNTFNKGENYFDVCSEQDKHDGDGATDLKRCAYVTISYNEYYNNHKTGLVGGSDSNTTANVTFHHNYYNQCQSRLPFARQANMHMYNNYYYKSTGNNMQIYAGAYAFIENCYFKNTNKTFTLDDKGVGTPAVKSYNNTFDGCSSSGATIVTNRAQAVSNDNIFGSTFDTNSSIFYYDSTNKCSNVSILNDTEDIPTIIPSVAGAGKFVTLEKTNNQESSGSTDTDPEVIYTQTKPTEAGIYGTVTGANSTVLDDFTTECNVQYSNNKFYINDTSDAYATNAYYMFENTYNSGKVTYTVNVSLNGVGSKWNIVQFLGSTKTIAVRAGGLNTDDKLKYAYSLDNGTSETIISSSKFASSTSYTIILTIDYTNSTAKLSINGTEVTITGYTLEEIKGIQLMTANSATDRSYTATITVSQQ